MQIVRGLFKGRIGATGKKRTTDTVHEVNGDRTACGIDYRASKTLGFPEEGKAEDVTCGRCKS